MDAENQLPALPPLRYYRPDSSQNSSQCTIPLSDPASSLSDNALIGSPLAAPSILRKTLDGRYVYYHEDLRIKFLEW